VRREKGEGSQIAQKLADEHGRYSVDNPIERLASALSDRYKIERELGSGGMATVYLAEDLKHERQVAIKVLRPELAAALGPDRFLREIDGTTGI
jgi:serine/threonine-protein kinase